MHIASILYITLLITISQCEEKLGLCCRLDGSCDFTVQYICERDVYLGDLYATLTTDNMGECESLCLGSCCIDKQCSDHWKLNECIKSDGIFKGFNSACDDVFCNRE
jgi:hypothetical protein